MKRLPLFKQMVLACGIAVAASLITSCSTTDPGTRAAQFAAGAPVAKVYSHNDANNPANRSCTEVGPLPESTARALTMWLRDATVKNFSYANPQYYVSLPTENGKSTRVWGICSDRHGNLVGILIPRDGVAAWDLPTIGSYRVYVNDTLQRKPLSEAIMEALADAGYDAPRIDSLKATGLDDERYLISKPLTEAEKQRLEEKRKKEEAAAEAAAKAAAATSSAAAEALETTEDDADTETATPVSDADDSGDSTDDADDTAADSSDDTEEDSTDDTEEDE